VKKITSFQVLVERIAATVLLAVVAALGWMVLVAYEPLWLRLPAEEWEIIVVLGLMLAALILVGLVAMLHTRP